MTEHDCAASQTPGSDDAKLSADQLRTFQWGVAATLMPVTDGWRIHYFSVPDFDNEPGTNFPSFDVAIAALRQVLPTVNSDQARAAAREELERHHHQSAAPDLEGV